MAPLDWVKKDDEYFWDDSVVDQETATELHGDGAAYVGESVALLSKNGDNVVDATFLNADGTVQSSSGNFINYSFRNAAGSKITPSSSNLAKANEIFVLVNGLNSEIDAHIQMAQMMGVSSKPLARAASIVGRTQVFLDIAQNGLDDANGNIGLGRASFRMGGTIAAAIASSAVGGEVGSVVGTAFGPGFGTAAGAITGASVSFGATLGMGVIEQAYDQVSTGVTQGYRNFMNNARYNISRYR